MNNFAFILLISLISKPVFATKPSEEMRNITRALIHSPDLITKLKSKGTDGLNDYKITELKNGFIYKLNFDVTAHHCHPCGESSAIIWETWDDTQSHMPTTYRSEFEYDSDGFE